MPKFIWSEKFEMGIANLDAQHRYMFGLANEITALARADADPRQLNEAIEGLIEYVQLHFNAEERAMEKCGYPMLDKHRQEHVDLTQRLFKLGLTQPTKVQSLELSKLVIHWLQHHIMESDMAFGKFINAHSKSD